MEKLKIETLKIIVSLFKVSSKDETRIFLNGVNVKNDNEHCILQSSNGYTCNETKLVDDSFLQFVQSKESFIISNKNEKKLKLMLKENKENTYFYIDDSFNLYNYEKKILISLDTIDREYVKLDAVIGNLEADNDDFKLAVSFKELKKLVESMENTAKNGLITFNLKRDYITENNDCYLKPIVLTSPCNINQKAILMPCKV